MEDKYKELLELHRSKFNLVVDVERLFPILESSEVLVKCDIDEVNKQPNGPAKVNKLLDILIAKENLAFKSLCYALESTYPHLLTLMFLGNNNRVSNPETRSLSLTSDSEEDVLSRSQNSADSRSQDLKSTYTRIIPSHEYEISDTGSLDKKFLRDHGSDPRHKGTKHKHSLGSYKLGLNSDGRHSNHDYDWLKSQCERAMTELQLLKHQQMDNAKHYEAVIKESDSYRQNYKVTLTQLQQAKEDMNGLRMQNSDLLTENKRMEQEIKNLRKMRDEDKQELDELRKNQRDMINEMGSNEMLNAFDQHDRIKHDYDSLRERYSDLVTQHSAVMSQLDNAKKENLHLKTQYEAACQERDNAVDEKNSLKQQCTEAIRNWDQALYERNELIEKSSKITQQRDDVMVEMNKALANHLRSKKELEIIVKDRDAALREYSLVMSERDMVHKEIEQLQDKLQNNSKHIETLVKEKKQAQDEAETLKREIKSALQDRDKAVKEKNELNDKLSDSITKIAVIEKQKDELRKDNEMALHERDIARKERQEVMQDRDKILREKYERDQAQKEKADKMDLYNKETEHLKKQIEKMQQEIMVGAHEAEIAKNRRDWAFGERDKIVHERDSIRTLCDNLRRDRDRAVSDLAQALSDYDEMKKQKYEALKELKDLREKYEFMNDKETRKSQLNSVGHNHSRDSAIDADLQEWETETVDIEIGGLDFDDLGFDLVGGKDDPQFPNDNSIFVSHVTKGSAADGKLKVNDQLLRVNNNDVSNVDKKYVLGVLRSRSGIVSMQVIRRRKISPSRSWQAVQLNIPPGKDLGIRLDNGLFISRINPGSYAAKEGILTVGDRIVSVNGRSIENMTPDDLLKLLYQCGGDTLMLDVWRQNSPLNSAGSSPIPSMPCAIPNIPDNLVTPAFKHDSRRSNNNMWESVSESSKGSMKNIKTSGSQTDSLDSPSLSRKEKGQKNSEKDLDHKGRHSVHLLDKAILKVDKIFRQRHKSQERERDHEDKSGTLLSVRPRTMIETDDNVLREFDYPLHSREDSNSASRQTSHNNHNSHNNDLESDISGTGTWPKCVRVNPASKGTVVLPQHQKNHQKRPTLEAVINPIPVQKVPPLPPERTDSFVAVRHTPQNSDSTITYNSHPSSPIHSPQQSNSSQYIPKSPLTRRSCQQENSFSNMYNHNHNQGQNMPHSARVNNTKNPPRMPHIQSTINPQFQLEPKLTDRQIPKNRPVSYYNNRENRTHSYGGYLSSQNPSVDYSSPGHDLRHYGPRSNNPTPEPLSSPPHTTPSQFTSIPPGGRHYPKPNVVGSSRKPPNAFGPGHTPLQPPVKAREHNVQQATFTTYISPAVSLPESITDIEHPPPYRPSPSNLSSRSPSQLSSSERFTPIPIEQYPLFTGTSPIGPDILDSDFKSNRKIRIPSTPSIMTNDTSGSVDVEPDRNSPCSPFPDLSIGKMLPSTSPHAEHSRNRKKPHPGETRKINIEKTSKLVGFQIELGPSGGIFVSRVNENSLAAQAGLVIGDQLLEICEINMRNATYDLAARVLQQCGNNLTMLVQYNPQKYNDNSGSSAASSTNTSPMNSPDSTLTKKVVIGGLTHRESAKSPRAVRHSSSAGKYEVPRKVSFKKPNPNANLGITLAGGNAMGIFVHEVLPESPAAGHNGLHTGDQILEYNGIDFTRATVEQAFRQLKEPCSSVRIRVRYHPSLYNKVRSKKGGDSFYVRAMFDHSSEKDGELGFHKDDILHIEDSMYNGILGCWYAWIVNDDGQKIKGGTIPSKERLEDDLVLRRSLSENLSLHDSEELKGPTRRGSGSARRSFFRRKRHQRNNSKDSRELGSFSDASLNSDSLPVLDDLSLCTYTSLEKLECKACRPVVLIAPLADALIRKLHAESPDKYSDCEPFKMQTSHHEIEQGLKDGIYIDYWQKEDHYLCVRVKAVIEISNKNIHCLLNVSPKAIERLHRQQIYPIVIYARHKSYKQIKEVRDGQFLPDKISNKLAKDLFDYCQKAEQEYRHLLSATIQGGNLAEMTQQIKNVIATEQEKPVWIPSCTMR